jgi:hypothetical protein
MGKILKEERNRLTQEGEVFGENFPIKIEGRGGVRRRESIHHIYI